VFLPNYSYGNIKTNSIQPVSTCLAFFEAIWHIFESGLAFFVHLDVATLSVAYILFAPLFIHLKYFEASPLLCVVKGILLDIGRNL